MDLSNIKDTSKLKLILELAQVRCQQLKKITVKCGGLNLFVRDGGAGAGPAFGKFFHPYIEIIYKITELDLSFSHLTDRDISLIGAHGKFLKLLNVQGSLL